MNENYIIAGESKVRDTRFLLALNKDDRDLYVLHREFPRCLIFVETHKTPVNFVVLDIFEAEEDEDKSIEVLTSEEFKEDLRAFFNSQAFDFERN